MKQSAEDYSPKLLFDIEITSKNFIEMIQFYEQNYTKHKEALKQSLAKYKNATEYESKNKKMIDVSEAEVSKLEPQRKEIEKTMSEKRDEISRLLILKSDINQKQQDDDKPREKTRNAIEDLEDQIKSTLAPFVDKIQNTINTLNKIELKEILEYRNVSENHAPSKFILSQVFAMIGENTEYDYIRKNMDPNKIKTISSIDYAKQDPTFVTYINETVNSPDFQPESFNPKIHTLSVKFSDWIQAVNKYNVTTNEIESSYKKLSDLNRKLDKQNNTYQETKSKIEKLSTEISVLEKEVQEMERNRTRIQGQI